MKVFQKFDVVGIAVLTPLFLTPIGGSILALAFGVKKGKILLHMTWTNFVWAFVLSYAFANIVNDIKLFFADAYQFMMGLF